MVLVKPSKPTPDVSLSLSTIDNNPNFEKMVQSIYVFSAPKPYREDEAYQDPASLLQQAVSDALFYYYPFARKLHRKSKDNILELICKPEDGVLFIRATSACTLSSLNYLESAGDAAYQLVPCYEPVKGCEGYDHMALQVTTFTCGGVTIGMSQSHAISDGVGAGQFFRIMFNLASGKTQPTVIPVCDRERLNFNGKLRDVVDFPKASSSVATSSNALTGDMVCKIMNITSEDIMKQKKTIVEEENTNGKEKKVVVTTLEVLAAHVWRARCRALNMSPDKTTVLVILINIRNIMEPPLPESYYGNTFVEGFVALTARELSESPLSHVVKLIKDMKRAALDKRYVLGQLSKIERRLNMMTFAESVDGGTMMLTDWRHIAQCHVSWGDLVSIIPLIPLAVPFLSVLLPPSKAVPKMSGGVRVMVTLPKDAMAKFKEEMNDF